MSALPEDFEPLVWDFPSHGSAPQVGAPDRLVGPGRPTPSTRWRAPRAR